MQLGFRIGWYLMEVGDTTRRFYGGFSFNRYRKFDCPGEVLTYIVQSVFLLQAPSVTAKAVPAPSRRELYPQTLRLHNPSRPMTTPGTFGKKFSRQENFGIGLDKGTVVVYTVGG